MSNKIVNLVDKARIGDPVAKGVLRKIADQSNDFGAGVWSSHEYLAWILEYTRVTVANKCKFLKDDLKVLDWTQRKGTSNLYTIDVDVLKTLVVEWEGVNDVDTPVNEVYTPVKEIDTPVNDVDTSHVLNPIPNHIIEPERVVISPMGTTTDEKDICEHCQSAPKKSKRSKYCQECTDLGKCTRCGDNKIERYPTKRRELCHVCGALVDPMYKSLAVLTFKKRSKHQLPWQAVEAITHSIGSEPKTLYAWGKWLDYWKTNGWFMGKNAVGKILQGFAEHAGEYMEKSKPTQVNNTFDKYRPPRPDKE